MQQTYSAILLDLGGVLIDIDYHATEKAFEKWEFHLFFCNYSPIKNVYIKPFRKMKKFKFKFFKFKKSLYKAIFDVFHKKLQNIHIFTFSLHEDIFRNQKKGRIVTLIFYAKKRTEKT
jgi:capsule polysaccharide export protein KpsC/LpsZ